MRTLMSSGGHRHEPSRSESVLVEVIRRTHAMTRLVVWPLVALGLLGFFVFPESITSTTVVIGIIVVATHAVTAAALLVLGNR